MVAEEMGMFEDEVRMIELAAPLHDLGRIAIPDALLMKPGPLTDEETRLMRRHPEIGHELLSGSQNRFIQDRKRVEKGKRVHVRVDLGGPRIIKKKKNK